MTILLMTCFDLLIAISLYNQRLSHVVPQKTWMINDVRNANPDLPCLNWVSPMPFWGLRVCPGATVLPQTGYFVVTSPHRFRGGCHIESTND